MDHYMQPPFQPLLALAEFFDAFDVPRLRDEIDEETRNRQYVLGMDLITEEYQEVYAALKEGDLPHIAKELADLLYVVFWAGEYLGLDLEKIFRAVHGSNMSKIGPEGQIERDAGGKVRKGLYYREPELTPEVILQRPESISAYPLQLPLF